MTFANRHIGPDHVELPKLLEAVGVASLDDLIEKAVPASILISEPLDLPPARSETEALADLADLAGRNEVFTSLIGMGYYNTITPGVITRNVLENPAWYTAYTPYQPEISQGRLEALINFQTMVMDLTGTDLTNASLLDEGTAAAEAMTLCHRATKARNDVFFVDRDCHPQTIDVVRTRAEPLGIKVLVGDPRADLDGTEVFGLLVQYPASSGEIHDDRALFEKIHAQGGLVTVATDLLALTMLTPPGELGADVVVGTTQRFGVPLGFGGPHAAFLATTEKHKRTIPGRIVGMSVDAAGRPAARLALQTREQHIRREKATSNICTAQVLLAVIAGMYAVYHGPAGITEIAQRVHRRTTGLVAGLRAAGIAVTTDHFFDTVTVAVPGRAEAVHAAAVASEINLRHVDGDHVGISFDETTTAATVAAVLLSFGIADVSEADVEAYEESSESAIPATLVRTSEFLTHPIFHTNHSETEMLRYLRRLADKDIALDRSMIPLGSCTMKLNATSEMVPITWPEFGSLHPFAPLSQSAGYLELFSDLEAWLAECTGYDAVSLQPNAGSQGELAGLLAIRRYHESRGENARDICLIPSSAHGTNAASAVMAGMRVVVVACDDEGNVDVADLRAKATEHSDSLAAAMITYPSTHGVFETAVGEICDVMHEHGGQVYVDGANLNALVGVAKPGKFGADVSHLNLHKTFCIPHGGGGPGVGPIGVGAHLAPFLPTSSVVPEAGPENAADVVSAAPWGSAGILPIPWMYLAMMGADGLRRATAMAILNANYLALKIGPHFPVLYRGEGGLVAHECIIDIRPITEATGVTVDDVAKRLIDYGFHAPTMSFPVAGTLMIEPTESEPLAELDRFVDAMVSIKGEIDRVASGEWPEDDNPLRNSPHPAEDLLVADWTHPYTREEAAYPDPSLRANKYWAPVSRIDGAHGDRNLICSCPTVEDLAMQQDK